MRWNEENKSHVRRISHDVNCMQYYIDLKGDMKR